MRKISSETLMQLPLTSSLTSPLKSTWMRSLGPAFRLALSFALLTTTAQAAWSYTPSSTSGQVPELPHYSKRYIRHGMPIEEELTLEKLSDQMDSRGVRTIEEFISILPPYMKNDNYVLMYRSRSLQAATPESPRAILYTPSARLILSFNGGNPGSRGADTIELIQFRDKDKTFEFREIYFPKNGRPEVSQANPRKCLECHQSPARKGLDLRPNWEPYNIWPGAFGSNSGHISRGPLKKSSKFIEEKTVPQDETFLEEQAIEPLLLKRFFEGIKPFHPRFQQLGAFDDHATVKLTEHLSVLNFQRVARIIQALPIFRTHRPMIELGIRCRSNFFRNPLVRWHLSRPVTKYYDYRSETSVSSMLTVLFEPLGIDTSDWSMDFRTRARLTFAERFGTPSVTASVFSYAWAVAGPKDNPYENLSCDQIEARMMSSLEGFYASGEHLKLAALRQPLERGVPAILNRCARCHTDPDDGFTPQIPFDDPKALRGLLSKSGYKRGTLLKEIAYRTSDSSSHEEQMPPAQGLNIEESKALMKHLESL
jgi:hypothetical protein